MTPTDRAEFAKRLHVTAEVFEAKMSTVRIEAYFVALADIPLADVVEALAHIERTAKWFPKPADVREAVVECTASDRRVLHVLGIEVPSTASVAEVRSVCAALMADNRPGTRLVPEFHDLVARRPALPGNGEPRP